MEQRESSQGTERFDESRLPSLGLVFPLGRQTTGPPAAYPTRLRATEQDEGDREADVVDKSKLLTKGARTRAMILRQAEESFRSEGYYDTTVASIAQALRVSEGTVFQHFGSKSGLLSAVMDEFYDELNADAMDILSAPGDAEERFRRLVDAWALRAERDWKLIREIVKVARYSTDPELNTRWKENNRRYTSLHRDLIIQMQEQGLVDPEVSPSLIRDIVFGTMEIVALGQDLAAGLTIRQEARKLLDLLVNRRVSVAGTIDERLDRIEEKLDAALRLGIS